MNGSRSNSPDDTIRAMARIAVVTGAGSGVGRAVVIDLAKRGYRVALVGRREEPLQQTISLCGSQRDALVAIPCDISGEKQVAQMADRLRKELGDPSVLINSAGTNIAKRSLAEVSTEDYRKLIDINLNGLFYCIAAFLPAMRAAGDGTIVNVISDAGLSANRVSGAAYIASKFGLTGLTATINAEERRNGIRACAVFPGEINTPLLDRRPVPPPAEARANMLQADDVSACVMLAIDLPQRATVEQIVVRPRDL
jgi:NAD(P)-dependent dehydrogenase (short-subunit alcohol dehydrogenase family)